MRRAAAQHLRGAGVGLSYRRDRPELAVAWQRLDDLRFRLTLRRGVVFQNGEPFDAEAVRFSLMRASQAFGATAGFPRSPAWISSIRTWSTWCSRPPTALFLYRVVRLALILPPKYFRQSGASVRRAAHRHWTVPLRPLGYDAREVRAGSESRVLAERYPKVSRVVYRYVGSEQALEELIDGSIDLLRRLNPRKTTQFMETGRGKIVKAWLPQLVLGVFNLLKPDTPLKDLRVRKAINLAIDREDLLRYGAIGNGRLLGGYTVPEDPNHAALPPYAFDPAQARRLLQEAGYEKGFSLSMLLPDAVPSQVEKIIAVSLAQVGIRVKVHRGFRVGDAQGTLPAQVRGGQPALLRHPAAQRAGGNDSALGLRADDPALFGQAERVGGERPGARRDVRGGLAHLRSRSRARRCGRSWSATPTTTICC